MSNLIVSALTLHSSTVLLLAAVGTASALALLALTLYGGLGLALAALTIAIMATIKLIARLASIGAAVLRVPLAGVQSLATGLPQAAALTAHIFLGAYNVGTTTVDFALQPLSWVPFIGPPARTGVRVTLQGFVLWLVIASLPWTLFYAEFEQPLRVAADYTVSYIDGPIDGAASFLDGIADGLEEISPLVNIVLDFVVDELLDPIWQLLQYVLDLVKELFSLFADFDLNCAGYVLFDDHANPDACAPMRIFELLIQLLRYFNSDVIFPIMESIFNTAVALKVYGLVDVPVGVIMFVVQLFGMIFTAPETILTGCNPLATLSFVEQQKWIFDSVACFGTKDFQILQLFNAARMCGTRQGSVLLTCIHTECDGFDSRVADANGGFYSDADMELLIQLIGIGDPFAGCMIATNVNGRCSGESHDALLACYTDSNECLSERMSCLLKDLWYNFAVAFLTLALEGLKLIPFIGGLVAALERVFPVLEAFFDLAAVIVDFIGGAISSIFGFVGDVFTRASVSGAVGIMMITPPVLIDINTGMAIRDTQVVSMESLGMLQTMLGNITSIAAAVVYEDDLSAVDSVGWERIAAGMPKMCRTIVGLLSSRRSIEAVHEYFATSTAIGDGKVAEKQISDCVFYTAAHTHILSSGIVRTRDTAAWYDVVLGHVTSAVSHQRPLSRSFIDNADAIACEQALRSPGILLARSSEDDERLFLRCLTLYAAGTALEFSGGIAGGIDPSYSLYWYWGDSVLGETHSERNARLPPQRRSALVDALDSMGMTHITGMPAPLPTYAYRMLANEQLELHRRMPHAAARDAFMHVADNVRMPPEYRYLMEHELPHAHCDLVLADTASGRRRAHGGAAHTDDDEIACLHTRVLGARHAMYTWHEAGGDAAQAHEIVEQAHNATRDRLTRGRADRRRARDAETPMHHAGHDPFRSESITNPAHKRYAERYYHDVILRRRQMAPVAAGIVESFARQWNGLPPLQHERQTQPGAGGYTEPSDTCDDCFVRYLPLRPRASFRGAQGRGGVPRCLSCDAADEIRNARRDGMPTPHQRRATVPERTFSLSIDIVGRAVDWLFVVVTTVTCGVFDDNSATCGISTFIMDGIDYISDFDDGLVPQFWDWIYCGTDAPYYDARTCPLCTWKFGCLLWGKLPVTWWEIGDIFGAWNVARWPIGCDGFAVVIRGGEGETCTQYESCLATFHDGFDIVTYWVEWAFGTFIMNVARSLPLDILNPVIEPFPLVGSLWVSVVDGYFEVVGRWEGGLPPLEDVWFCHLSMAPNGFFAIGVFVFIGALVASGGGQFTNAAVGVAVAIGELIDLPLVLYTLTLAELTRRETRRTKYTNVKPLSPDEYEAYKQSHELSDRMDEVYVAQPLGA